MKLSSISVTYTQEADSCAPDDLDQQITISTQDSGAGPFLVISTKRWALDENEIAGFVNLLRATLNEVNS
jgi:hypothetical protein